MLPLRGHFKGSELKWSVPEKECYKHLLQCSEGFSLYTDHRNLVYILDLSKDL